MSACLAAMKVLLVHPPPYNGVRIMRLGRVQDDAIPNIRADFPIFLGHTAAVLREGGHSVAVLDATVDNLSLVDVKKRIKSLNPDAIIVETAPVTFQGDLSVAEIAKQINPEISTIYYGLFATARPRAVVANKDIDFAIVGEPEYTSLELVNALEHESDLGLVKGIFFKENNIVKQNPARPFIENLDQLPYPARDLFPMGKYIAEPLGKITNITISRGCPHSRCIFCAANLMEGNKFRARNPKNVVDEIESVVHKFSVRTFFFFTCNFSLWGDSNIVQFSKELCRRKLNIRWLTNSRVDTLPSENALRHMAKSGCFLLQFGVESGSPRMIAAMHKVRRKEEAEKYVEAVKPSVEKTKKMGIFTHIQMIMGFQGENRNTINESINLVKKSAPDLPVNFDVVYPLPGTILGKTAEQKGLFPSSGEDWLRYNHRKMALELSAMGNNTTPDEIEQLRDTANATVKFSLEQKIRLFLKLLARGDFDISLNAVKLYINEGFDVYKIRWGRKLTKHTRTQRKT